MEANNLNHKIALWTQMQSFVVEIENRNHSILNFGSILSVAFTVASMAIDEKEYNMPAYLYAIVPAIVLLVMFSATFHNKYSAILRGYIAGLEESINKDIREEVFLWNKGYNQLFHGRFFFTNDSIGALYSLVAFIAPGYCFYNLFTQTSADLYISAYLIIYIAFLLIFLYDLFTNGKSKKYAMIYFFLHQNVGDDDWKDKYRISDIRLIERIINKKS